jgi:hypothetical protein
MDRWVISKPDMASLETAFNIFDLNHDGHVNVNELDKFLGDVLSLHTANTKAGCYSRTRVYRCAPSNPPHSLVSSRLCCDDGLWSICVQAEENPAEAEEGENPLDLMNSSKFDVKHCDSVPQPPLLIV